MANFSHLDDLAVDNSSTAEFIFSRIMGTPVLTVRPAHRVNRDFLNEMLSASKEVARRIGKLEHEDTDFDKVRENDADVFARCIVTGWRNVVDSDGNEVEFTRDNCREFLLAIPEDMFDNLRTFCLTIDNFRAGRARPKLDPKEEKAASGN